LSNLPPGFRHWRIAELKTSDQLIEEHIGEYENEPPEIDHGNGLADGISTTEIVEEVVDQQSSEKRQINVANIAVAELEERPAEMGMAIIFRNVSVTKFNLINSACTGSKEFRL